jgi:hypothetical protein
VPQIKFVIMVLIMTPKMQQNTSNWCSATVDRVFVKGTNKIKLDAVKQHESSKPHQYYQCRYNRTSIFRSLRKKFSFPGFFIILFFATCLLNFLLGIDPSTYRRKLMAEIYLAIPELMFCNWCRNHEVDRVFVKETNKFKLDAVKQHESSKPHQYYQSY